MKKVLIVEDEQRIIDIYLRLLVPAGLIVRYAKDAQAATSILVREDIDLILLDIKIPKIDGRTIFEIIEEYNPNIKVIVSSVYPIEKQKELIPRAANYYDKSEGPIPLLEKVKSALAA
ncbi:MAG: response regulator [Candidatus Omnitrophica bacterium]|nr:response regulator [Candidatus Omnitrophota bacterium]